MTKRKISKKQQSRIAAIQQRRRERAEKKEGQLGEEQQGLLVTHYGKYADVEHKGQIYRCHFRQNLGATVVGDEVIFCLDEQQQGIIVAINPRESSLYRLGEKGDQKMMAVNIDQMIIVIAAEPKPSHLLLDSYLIAAELLQIEPLILFNKTDLNEDYEIFLKTYKDLDYTCLSSSIISQHGLDVLINHLASHCSVLVGQSGVGKSSIIQALLPTEDIRVGTLHKASALGKHTTTVSKLYHLPQEGELIDSPGIREFTLWPLTATELAKGFREFQPYLNQCKFRDCSHSHEPGCAVLKAMDQDRIQKSRWESYQKLISAS